MQQLFSLIFFGFCTFASVHSFFWSDGTKESKEISTNRAEDLIEEYFPVLVVLCNSTDNETESLEKLLKQRTYAELKRVIDARLEETVSSSDTKFSNGTNTTEVANLLTTEFGQKYLHILEAYHNASIYAIIRGLWNSQLYSILPPIDQYAILDYFEERLNRHNANKSMWQRAWEAVQRMFLSKTETCDCGAEWPECVRRLAEGMDREERTRLGRAADQDHLSTLDNAITLQLSKHPEKVKAELEAWKSENHLPIPLLNIVNDATNEEKLALQRLRRHGLTSSLKTYYRAMIEMKDIDEQKEIWNFVKRMNNTFASCYNPLKSSLSIS